MYWLTKISQKKTLLSLVAVFAFGLLLVPALTKAAVGDPCGGVNPNCPAGEICGADSFCALAGEEGYQDKFGLTDVKKGLGTSLGDAELPVVVGSIINIALSMLGVVAIVIVLIGGFKWMTAGGNDDQVAEARKWIFSGIIGLAIILSAWAITTFVFKSLNTALNDASVAADDF